MRVCLFDIDGTLISTGGAGKDAIQRALMSEFGIERPLEGVSISGRTDRGIAADQFRLHGIENTPRNWERLRAAYVGSLPGFLSRRRGAVLPGVCRLLERLRGDGVVLGLLTGNTAEGARLKLVHFALYDYFDFGSFGDHHPTRDDIAREALDLAHRHIGEAIDPRHVVVLGDTPLDVQCARVIGATSVAVATGMHPLEELAATNPDILLADFSDTAGLVARLRGGV